MNRLIFFGKRRDAAALILLLAIWGGAVFFASPCSAANTSLIFNGDTDYVNCGNSANLQITGNLTIEAWVKPSSKVNTSTIIGKKLETSAASNPGYALFINEPRANNQKIGFGSATSSPLLTTTGVITWDIWQHVAVTVSNNTVGTIYLNGQPQTTTGSADISTANTAQDMLIGSVNNYFYFSGQIDEVRIWNVARTQAEISQCKDLRLIGNESGLVAYYRFDEGSGTAVNDSAGGDNSGLFRSPNPLWSEDSASATGTQYSITGSVMLPVGARVSYREVMADNLDTGARVTKATNADGSYQMTELTGGTWKVQVAQIETISHYVSSDPIIVIFADDTAATASNINFQLMEPSVSLTVSVLTPDNQPVRESCEVEVVNVESGRAFYGLTDTGSGFYIALPESGFYNVSLWIDPDTYPSYAAPVIPPVNVTKIDQPYPPVVLEKRDAVVSGTVKNSATGLPISGISINACQPGGSWFDTQTGADGTYRLNLPPGIWDIDPADESLAYLFTDSAREVKLTKAGSPSIDFKMEPAVVVITGKVQDEAGNKLTDAEGWIYARRKTGTDWRIISQADVSDGVFSLKVPANVTDFVFGLEADNPYTLENTEIQPDAQNKILIHLKKNSAVIKGKLTDKGGNAVTGIKGAVFATPSDIRNPVQSTIIDPDTGMFELLLSEGKWSLSYEILTEKYADAPLRDIEIKAVSGENSLNIPLIPLLGKVKGRVTDPDGKPVRDIEVWVRQYLDEGLFEKMVFSDLLGTFSCPVPSAEAEVTVGTAVETFELPSLEREASKNAKSSPTKKGKPSDSDDREGTGFELKLRRADTLLTGKVIDKSTGEGLDGASVYAYSSDGQEARGTADESGVFRIEVARVDGNEEGSNLWFVSAVWEPDDSDDYYTGNPQRIDISGTDDISVPDIALEASGTLSSGEVYEFSLSDSGDCLLGDKTGVEIPANVIASDQSQRMKVTVEPQAQGLSESSEDQVIAYGYAVGMYSKETGRKFSSDLNKDIMMTLNYTDEELIGRGIKETYIRPAYFLEASGTWQAIKSFTLDTENNTVNFRTDHLSVWALIAPRIGGDMNGDGMPAELGDAILALQVCAGYEISETVYDEADISGDGKIGLAEAIYILKSLSSF